MNSYTSWRVFYALAVNMLTIVGLLLSSYRFYIANFAVDASAAVAHCTPVDALVGASGLGGKPAVAGRRGHF